MNLDGNKLANVRRDIMNKKRLTDFEIRDIKQKVITGVKDIDSGNEVLGMGMMTLGMKVQVD